MAFCTQCGKELRSGDRFCGKCGAPVQASEAGGPGAPRKRTDWWKYVLTGAVAVLAVAAVVLIVVKLTRSPEPAPAISETLSAAEAPSTASPEASAEVPVQISVAPEPTPEPTPESSSPLEVLRAIEVNPDFVADSLWEPLAVCEDLDQDGVEEVLAVYEMKSGNTVQVMCDLWRLEDLICCVGSWNLYTEVGGNSGSAGVARLGDQTYLTLIRKEPEGDSFNDYIRLIPWESGSLGDAEVYLERHGTYGAEDSGTYILGDTRVSREEYEARQAEFMPMVYELNLLNGAGNGGVMTFETMKRFYAGTN